MEPLISLLKANQVFLGGVALTVLGSFAAFLYKLPGLFWPFFRRKFVSQLDFANDDLAYQWALAWISAQEYTKNVLHVRVLAKSQSDSDQDSPRPGHPEPLYVIPEGLHWFYHKNRFVWVLLTKTRLQSSQTPAFAEEIKIASLFASKEFLQSIVEEGKRIYEMRDLSSIAIHVPTNWGRTWKLLTRRPKRPLSSLVYDNNLGHEVLQDIQHFLVNREWYLKMDIPWRRSYLLHGTPGSGKTSLIAALAAELQRDIYSINLNNTDFSDDRLLELMNSVPMGDFLLIEEVDCIFEGRDMKTDRQQLTFGGLLAALDGVASAEGRILFMTTNHRERLDPALIRPGRADSHIEFKGASHQQVCLMFERFFPEYSKEDIRSKVQAFVQPYLYSMSQIQELLVTHRTDPKAALLALEVLDRG